MADTSDKYVNHPDIVCCGDIIEYTFLICNEEETKHDSKGRIINSGQDVENVNVIIETSLNGSISAAEVGKGVISDDFTTWNIPVLRTGEQVKAVISFTVEDDCSEEFKVQMNIDCLNLCVTKKVNPLTCCEVKICTSKGELDCTQLTK